MTTTVVANGNTYTDDSNATTGMGNGGWRPRLLRMLSDVMVDVAAKLATMGGIQTSVTALTSTIAAAQSTLVMAWDAGTVDADPGAGKVRASTVTLTNGTYTLFVSTTDTASGDATATLADYGAGTSAIKGKLRLVKIGAPSVYLDVSVTGVTVATGYRKVSVTYLAGPGGFVAGDAVALGFTGRGEKGDIGATGVTGATGAAGPVPMIATTSSSSVTIGTGSKSFITTAVLNLAPGAELLLADHSAPTTNWMLGAITTISGTSVTMNATATAGSGTISNWDVNLSAPRGQTGATGPAGADGLQAASNAETVGGSIATKAVTPASGKSAYIMQGLHTIFVPAGAMKARITNGPASSTSETSSNKITLFTWDFDAATDQYVQFQIAMPKSWDRGSVYAEIIWRATSSSGSVVWGIQALALSDGDTIDMAFGTAQTAGDALTSTTALQISTLTSAVTVGNNPAQLDHVIFQVYRNASAGGDTLGALAALVGVRLYYSINVATDA